MKRKNNYNISNSSLRSSSRRSKVRQAAVSSGLSSSGKVSSRKNKPIQKNQEESSLKNKQKSKTIGSTSNMEIYCRGCNNVFKIYQDIKTFITLHVKSNDICKSVHPKCVHPCNKIFYDESNLRSHQARCGKSSNCYKDFLKYKAMTEYSSSQVQIPKIQINNETNNNVPSHLKNYDEYNKKLMLSKHHNDYSSFLSPITFMNKNIHHSKPLSKLEPFKGHALMDPNKLKMKNSVLDISNLKKDKSTSSKSSNDGNKKICREDYYSNQQIVDFSTMEYNYSPTSNKSTNMSDISSSQSGSSIGSNANSTTDILCSNEIIDNIVLYDSDENDLGNLNNMSIQRENENSYKETISVGIDNSNNSINNFNNIQTNIYNCNHQINNFQKQESIKIDSETHFLKIDLIKRKELANSICDEEYKECLELVQILMKHKIPVNDVYKELCSWHSKKQRSSETITISSLLERAEQRVYGLSLSLKMKPIQSNLICPSGRHVTVTSFDIDGIIYDLLSDYELCDLHNLIFTGGNESNPFINEDSDYYSEFNTSEFYIQTCKMKKINCEKEVLVPIQLYMDETTLDNYSHLQLHPLVLTLLIFNQKTRNLSMAWRTLAYIPNFDSLFDSKDYNVEMKHNDFHFCLRYLLSGLETLLSSQDTYIW